MKKALKKFLNAYWLRPETALWRTLDVESMNGFEFVSPSLDMGCGDGTFSFLRAEGEFDKTFDVFQNVDNIEQFFNNVDVYDSYSDSYKASIKKCAKYQIDFGLDHKTNLLMKAKKTGLYKNIIVADANKKLPFESEFFQTVFSNIIYWLNDPYAVFSELNRVLKPKGKCCIMLPNISYLESSFYYQYYLMGGQKSQFDFLKLIDRGRIQDNLKIVRKRKEWEEMIGEAGFEIISCVPHLSKTLIQIWDIGLRPIFPLLKKMTQNIELNKLMEIKEEWVNVFEKIGYPIIENDDLLLQGCEHTFLLYRKFRLFEAQKRNVCSSNIR